MTRREFLVLAGAAGLTLALPRALRAQAGPIRRGGYLDIFPAEDPQSKVHLDAFWQGVGEQGWTPQNLAMDFRWGGNTTDKSKGPAQELVAENPDVIFSVGNTNLVALAQQTPTIPIVFCFAPGTTLTDLGLSGNFSGAHDNITGFVSYSDADIRGKYVELLSEVAPNSSRCGLIFNPDSITGAATDYVASFHDAAAKLGLTFAAYPVRSTTELSDAIHAFAAAPGGGLVIGSDSWIVANRAVAIAEVAKAGLPAVWQQTLFATDGALVAYAVDAATIVRGAAGYAGTLLRGGEPDDLPIQQAPLVMTVNLKTAKAMGITIPPSVLVSADTVIE